MPPKKDEAPKPKKKAEPPKELCGCGINTFRAPPKGKKAPVPLVHNPGCSFQRATCNRYPHLPKCASCEEICSYCRGINPWCIYCGESRCKFIYKRDVLVPLGTQPSLIARAAVAAATVVPTSAPSTAPKAA